jgi:hypothetical protein
MNRHFGQEPRSFPGNPRGHRQLSQQEVTARHGLAEDGRLTMRRVQTNAELAAIHLAASGVVLNDFTSGPTAGQYNVLHAAFCASVGRMLAGAIPEARPSVPKIFFENADEARAWLLLHRGEEDLAWKRHACRASPRPRAEDQDNARGATSHLTDGPFREAEVESLLYS